jgi:hypothetical protein
VQSSTNVEMKQPTVFFENGAYQVDIFPPIPLITAIDLFRLSEQNPSQRAASCSVPYLFDVPVKV